MFSYNVDVDKYHHRVGPDSVTNIKRVLPQIYQAQKQTNVPPRVFLGVVYNETNARPGLIGDGGRSYGLGQVRCHVWIHWLRERGLAHLKSCNQLLRPYNNVRAMGMILSYLKKDSSSWNEALEKYNSGQAAADIPTIQRRQKVISYRKRVNYFGELFMPYYDAYEDVYPLIKEFHKSIKRL
jgi:hypothetical protein